MGSFIDLLASDIFWLEKHLEQLLPVLLTYSYTLVSHPYVDTNVILNIINNKLVDRNQDLTSSVRKFDWVVNQIDQNLLHSQFVDHNSFLRIAKPRSHEAHLVFLCLKIQYFKYIVDNVF